MDAKSDEDDYSPEEAKRRFETALRAALTTPPKPHKDEPRKRLKRAPGRPEERASSRGGPSASSSPRGGRGRP